MTDPSVRKKRSRSPFSFSMDKGMKFGRWIEKRPKQVGDPVYIQQPTESYIHTRTGIGSSHAPQSSAFSPSSLNILHFSHLNVYLFPLSLQTIFLFFTFWLLSHSRSGQTFACASALNVKSPWSLFILCAVFFFYYLISLFYSVPFPPVGWSTARTNLPVYPPMHLSSFTLLLCSLSGLLKCYKVCSLLFFRWMIDPHCSRRTPHLCHSFIYLLLEKEKENNRIFSY